MSTDFSSESLRLKPLVQEARSVHPDKGNRKELPWSKVPSVLSNSDRSLKNLADSSYRTWWSNPDTATADIIKNLQAFVEICGVVTTRDSRAAARATDKRVRDEQGDSEAEAELPVIARAVAKEMVQAVQVHNAITRGKGGS